MDLVVEAFDGAGVLPVAFEKHRSRRVRLLDAPDDLVVDGLLEVLGGGHHRVRVCVLGLEMRDDLGIALLPQPVIRIDACVGVRLQHLWTRLRNRGFGCRADLAHSSIVPVSSPVARYFPELPDVTSNMRRVAVALAALAFAGL